jgi:diketogulonate reductase-like aldo/keto reductase
MLPIPGSLSLEHVKENLAARDLELDDAELQALS